ncbi:MAG TPA: ankyrin repeat domain-containing protein [Alphaproteobacteria bacterium]|jgi:ankyrin repeat protein
MNTQKFYSTQSMLQEKLWAAAARGDSATIRVLVMEGVNVHARNIEGFTAYNLATQNGHYNTALTILAARNMAFSDRLRLTTPGSSDAASGTAL